MTELVDIKEACKILGVKESWLRSVIFKSEIPVIKLGRLIRFRKIDLEKYIHDNLRPKNQGSN